MASALKRFVPKGVRTWLRRIDVRRKSALTQRLPPLSEKRFENIVRDELKLSHGALVFVHSSVDGLSLEFPFMAILRILRSVVGPEGTLVFPTYPRDPSYIVLRRGDVFDTRKSPSFTGALSELARRQRGAVRSLHPTKSVCALGPLAQDITASHHLSPYPYDAGSPYYGIARHEGVIVGIGVSTRNLSFVHAVDDALKESFPVKPYLPQLFEATCINAQGEAIMVPTLAHDPRKMVHNIPRYMQRHVPPAITSDMTIGGMRFFRAAALPLFNHMCGLARQGVTIYPRSVYSR